MVTISQLVISRKRERNWVKNNVTMIIALFLIIGMMTPVYAQSISFAVNEKKAETIQLDHARITKYVKSGILDVWVKKVITEEDRALKKQMDKQNAKKNRKASKKERAKQKEANEIYDKTSYHWLHLQFDPNNFRYKVLETYSYNKNLQLLSGGSNPDNWLMIPADSIEEKLLRKINEYVDNHIDQIVMK